jgi:hypothetical protein
MTTTDFDPSAALEAAEREHAEILGKYIRARDALEDIWPFVGHRASCATLKSMEAIGFDIRCDCGLGVALDRGNVRITRAVLKGK